jgi:hypothetical protein
MRRLVHLGINPLGSVASVPGSVNPPNFTQALETYIGRFAPDWFRYGAQNYVLWTDADLTHLATGIQALPGFQHVYLLLTEFNPRLPACDGMMSAAFWQWLYKPRS